MAGRTRKGDVFFQLGENNFKRREMLDLTRVQQLPTLEYIIERYFTIKDMLPLHEPNKENAILSTLAHELRFLWIFMNVPCLSYSTVRSKIKSICSSVIYLKNVKPEKRKEKWKNDVRELERKLFNGFDIRSHSDDTKRKMEALYGVKITEDEEKFYTDNCSLVDEHDNPLEKCARLRWCGKVDSKWWKRMLKRKEKMEKDANFQALLKDRMEKDQFAASSLGHNSIEVGYPNYGSAPTTI